MNSQNFFIDAIDEDLNKFKSIAFFYSQQITDLNILLTKSKNILLEKEQRKQERQKAQAKKPQKQPKETIKEETGIKPQETQNTQENENKPLKYDYAYFRNQRIQRNKLLFNAITEYRKFKSQLQERQQAQENTLNKQIKLFNLGKQKIEEYQKLIEETKREINTLILKKNNLIGYVYSQKYLKSYSDFLEEKRNRLIIRQEEDLNNYSLIDKRQNILKSDVKLFLKKLFLKGIIKKTEYRNAIRHNKLNDNLFNRIQYFNREQAKTGHKKILLGTEKQNRQKYIYCDFLKKCVKYRIPTIFSLEEQERKGKNTEQKQNAINKEIRHKIRQERKIYAITKEQATERKEKAIIEEINKSYVVILEYPTGTKATKSKN